MKIYIYQCMHYTPDDEYGLPENIEIEVVPFLTLEEAQKYREEFESVRKRNDYALMPTEYESSIITWKIDEQEKVFKIQL